MRKEQFVEGEFFHVYNRGVDHRFIFDDDHDRIRFVHSLYILNNFLEIPNRFDMTALAPREELVPIKPYVKIVAACLMDNHYHLMLTPWQEKGISNFLHKVGTSYTMYFNKRHERTGCLLEGVFKARHVDRDEYASYLTDYIHLNPFSLLQAKPGARKPGARKMLTQLETYKWSTLPDYLGKESHFSIVVFSEFRDEVLGLNADEYRDMLEERYLQMLQARML